MSIDRPAFRHPALDRFAPLAASYCALIERHAELSPAALLGEAHQQLAALYAAALALPTTDVLFVDDGEEDEGSDDPILLGTPADPDRLASEEWSALFHALAAQIESRDAYREVFDPYEPGDAPDAGEVQGSLADDLADIYRELRAGVIKWERGETGDALREWRFGFAHHWGEHATGALRALWAASAWHDLPWPSAGAGAA